MQEMRLSATAEVYRPTAIRALSNCPKLDKPPQFRFEANSQRCQPPLRQCQQFDDSEILIGEALVSPEFVIQEGVTLGIWAATRARS